MFLCINSLVCTFTIHKLSHSVCTQVQDRPHCKETECVFVCTHLQLLLREIFDPEF